jgi:regulator of sigma E protease
MPVLLTWVIIAIGVALLFTLTIFVHEFGHYWVARKLGLKVDGFSIGFGPKIFSWTDRDGVEWALRWLPLGGFVKLPQMITSEAIEGRSNPSIPPISPGKKIAVSLAGPVMNILFAFFIGGIVWWVGLPRAYNNTIIGYVPPGGAEANMGIREGDRIQAVNGRPVLNWEEVQRTAALSITSTLAVTIKHVDGRIATYSIPTEYSTAARLKFLKLGPKDHPAVLDLMKGYPAEASGLRKGDELISIDGIEIAGQQQLIDIIKGSADRPVLLELLRDGKPLRLTVTPILDPKDKVGRMGVTLGPSPRMTFTVERPGPTPWKQIEGTISQMAQLVRAIAHKKESRIGVENLQGPAGMLTGIAMEMKVDIRRALALMVIINVNLAILNLLPLPVLDGGHITFSIIELLTFRRIPAQVYESVTLVFGVLLLSFMAFVFYNDVRSIPLLRSVFSQESVVQAPSTQPLSTNPPPASVSTTNR